MRLRNRISLAVLSLVLLGPAACTDLEVVNEGAADREAALSDPADLQALISASFRTWSVGWMSNAAATPFLSTASFQHSSFAANYVMVDYSKFPRVPITNSLAGGDEYNYFAYGFNDNTSAASSIAEGLRAFDEFGMTLGDKEDRRLRVFGHFVQGLAHGHLALKYDKAYIFDETDDPADDIPLSPYNEVMEAALGYLDKAIQEAQSGDMAPIPQSWTGSTKGELTADDIIKIAYSMKARLRANVARTPDERAAVDWSAVIADVEAGLGEDWELTMDGNTWAQSGAFVYGNYLGWGQLTYFVHGMADQSGKYQKWMETPLGSRTPQVDGEPFLIITDDNRFPQGSTIDEQFDNPGRLYQIPRLLNQTTREYEPGYGEGWARPDRGEWRWSYYNGTIQDVQRMDWPVITKAELDLLKAEGLYRLGDLAGAAEIVNQYRVAANLSPTDASGVNTSCVPKLPDGECGNLWEMLKWEKRMETWWKGPEMNSWYFDGRGWGDLPEGTFLQFPVPERELFQLGIPAYTFGGVGGESAASVGTYGY